MLEHDIIHAHLGGASDTLEQRVIDTVRTIALDPSAEGDRATNVELAIKRRSSAKNKNREALALSVIIRIKGKLADELDDQVTVKAPQLACMEGLKKNFATKEFWSKVGPIAGAPPEPEPEDLDGDQVDALLAACEHDCVVGRTFPRDFYRLATQAAGEVLGAPTHPLMSKALVVMAVRFKLTLNADETRRLVVKARALRKGLLDAGKPDIFPRTDAAQVGPDTEEVGAGHVLEGVNFAEAQGRRVAYNWILDQCGMYKVEVLAPGETTLTVRIDDPRQEAGEALLDTGNLTLPEPETTQPEPAAPKSSAGMYVGLAAIAAVLLIGVGIWQTQTGGPLSINALTGNGNAGNNEPKTSPKKAELDAAYAANQKRLDRAEVLLKDIPVLQGELKKATAQQQLGVLYTGTKDHAAVAAFDLYGGYQLPVTDAELKAKKAVLADLKGKGDVASAGEPELKKHQEIETWAKKLDSAELAFTGLQLAKTETAKVTVDANTLTLAAVRVAETQSPDKKALDAAYAANVLRLERADVLLKDIPELQKELKKDKVQQQLGVLYTGKKDHAAVAAFDLYGRYDLPFTDAELKAQKGTLNGLKDKGNVRSAGAAELKKHQEIETWAKTLETPEKALAALQLAKAEADKVTVEADTLTLVAIRFAETLSPDKKALDAAYAANVLRLERADVLLKEIPELQKELKKDKVQQQLGVLYTGKKDHAAVAAFDLYGRYDLPFTDAELKAQKGTLSGLKDKGNVRSAGAAELKKHQEIETWGKKLETPEKALTGLLLVKAEAAKVTVEADTLTLAAIRLAETLSPDKKALDAAYAANVLRLERADVLLKEIPELQKELKKDKVQQQLGVLYTGKKDHAAVAAFDLYGRYDLPFTDAALKAQKGTLSGLKDKGNVRSAGAAELKKHQEIETWAKTLETPEKALTGLLLVKTEAAKVTVKGDTLTLAVLREGEVDLKRAQALLVGQLKHLTERTKAKQPILTLGEKAYMVPPKDATPEARAAVRMHYLFRFHPERCKDLKRADLDECLEFEWAMGVNDKLKLELVDTSNDGKLRGTSAEALRIKMGRDGEDASKAGTLRGALSDAEWNRAIGALVALEKDRK